MDARGFLQALSPEEFLEVHSAMPAELERRGIEVHDAVGATATTASLEIEPIIETVKTVEAEPTSPVERALARHQEALTQAGFYGFALPSAEMLDQVLESQSDMQEALNKGGELLLVPTDLNRAHLKEGLATILTTHLDLQDRIYERQPIWEYDYIAQDEAKSKLKINPNNYGDRSGGITSAEYAKRDTLITGFDMIVVTTDGQENEIPRANRGDHVDNYLKQTQNGQAFMGTYEEYLTLAMIKAAQGELIDAQTYTWLPNTFLSGCGGVARANFNGGQFDLGAWRPRANDRSGVRPVVRAKV